MKSNVTSLIGILMLVVVSLNGCLHLMTQQSKGSSTAQVEKEERVRESAD